MALRIYDTLTREKREFVPVRPKHVGMYVCGMTVQNKPHVGHVRSSLSGDIMRRYLEHLGYQVTYLYNFTDVDDKIIERANAEGIDYASVSERNIDAYLRAADACNILRATVYPRATRHIAEMHAMIANADREGARVRRRRRRLLRRPHAGRLRQALRPQRRRHARRAIASSRASRSATRSTSRCGRGQAGRARAGRARGDRDAPDGTSSARRWR